MKKTKLMALVLVGAISLTGAGYAAWSNTITDTTSINTGTWSVVLENDAPASYLAGDQVNTFKRGGKELAGDPDFGDNLGGGYDDAAAATNSGLENYVYTLQPKPVGKNVDGTTACDFAFTNLHPGTQAMTRFEMRNRGSIPAKIERVHVTFWNGDTQITNLDDVASANGQVINAMKVDPFFQIHRGSGSDEIPVINLKNVSLKDLEKTLDKKMKGIVLKPADSILSDELEAGGGSTEMNPIFTFKLPANSLKQDASDLNSTNLGMDASFKVRITFDFVQYNDVTRMANTEVTQPAK